MKKGPRLYIKSVEPRETGSDGERVACFMHNGTDDGSEGSHGRKEDKSKDKDSANLVRMG